MSEESKLVYDFFAVGQEIPPHTHRVTEEEIDDYCESYNETNPVYLDDDAAKEAGFEGRIAPPMMVRRFAHIQNVLKGFGKTVPGHSIHTAGDYHFMNVVRPGDTITTTGRITDKYIRKNRKFLGFEFVSRNQRGDTVVINKHTSIWPR